MKICEDHWLQMRAAVDARGLTPFVAKDGPTAVAQMLKDLEHGESRRDTFDPLMSVHWACVNNAMIIMDGMAPGLSLYQIQSGPEDPVDASLAGEKFAGRTWPRCPICYLNLAHEINCRGGACRLDKEHGYDYFIDRAADDALQQAREYGLVPIDRRQ